MRDLGSLPRGLQLVNLSSGTSSPNTRDFSSRLAAAADPEYSVPARTCFTWGKIYSVMHHFLFTRQPYTLFSVTRRSWSDNVSEWVTLRTELTDVTLVSSLDQNRLFVSESLVPLTQLAKWYKEPTNFFQSYRPRNDLLQAIFVFNGDFNGEMARFWISCRKMTLIWSIWF